MFTRAAVAGALWASLVAPAAAADLCLSSVPPAPSSRSKAISPEFESPPHQLVPTDYASSKRIYAGGRFYDDAGNTYHFRNVETFVDVYLHGVDAPTPTGTAAYYDGEYVTVFATVWTASGPIITPMRVPTDDVAWRKAQKAAKNARKFEREERRAERETGRDAVFAEMLCQYNQKRTAELANRAAAEQATATLSAIRDAHAPGLPLSALVLAAQLDQQLGLPVPAEPARLAADAQAVWALVNRVGTLDAATSALQAAQKANPSADGLTALCALVP